MTSNSVPRGNNTSFSSISPPKGEMSTPLRPITVISTGVPESIGSLCSVATSTSVLVLKVSGVSECAAHLHLGRQRIRRFEPTIRG